MNDLISRQAAIATAHLPRVDDAGYEIVRLDDILKLPSAQSERKVGKWHITDAYPHNVYCPVCHKKFAQTHWAVWEDGSLPRNFCPNCGAEMEGENNEIM